MFGRKVAVWGVALGLSIAPVYFTAPSAYAQDSGGQTSDLNNKKVTLNLENADIRYALKLLFQSVGANYTLDPGVQGSVTLALTDVSFRTALEAAIKGAGTPLTYRVENNVYNISPKVDTLLNPVDTQPEVDPGKPTTTTRTVKLQINFADAIDLATAFGGGVITTRLSQLGSQGGGGGFGGGFGGGGFGGGGQGGFGGGGFGGQGGGFGGGGFGGGGFGGGGFGGGGFGGGGLGGGGGFGGGGLGGGGGFGGRGR